TIGRVNLPLGISPRPALARLITACGKNNNIGSGPKVNNPEEFFSVFAPVHHGAIDTSQVLPQSAA
ncbi:MAG: hypothetical protein ACP5XB_19095, partial [Isosphaeraceae bacterium]